MAAVTKPTNGSGSSTPQIPNNARFSEKLIAGEDIAGLDACYLNTDGKVYRATGAAANQAAQVMGFAAIKAKLGQSITLLHSCMLPYPNSLQSGTRLFLSGTVAGGLDSAASTGGTKPIAVVFDANRIWVLPPHLQ
jgi:hypothetical protein